MMEVVPARAGGTARHNIQDYLREPPSFQELLVSKALRRIYRWHMISLYCPENLLFRERVEEYKAMWADGRPEDLLRLRSRKIVTDFCTTDSPMEINIDEKMKRRLVELAEAPTESMFDAPLTLVDKDICRSLQSFWVTEIFLAYYENKALIDDLLAHEDAMPSFDSGAPNRARSSTLGHDGASRDSILQTVRTAYNSQSPIFLTRIFDVTSAFTYTVHQNSKQGPHVGYAIQRGANFFFHDLNEKLVLKVLAVALLGQSVPEEPEPEPTPAPAAPEPAESGGGCFGRRRASSAPPSPAPKPVTRSAEELPWYVKDSTGAVTGPLPQATMLLLWKYHILPPQTHVSTNNKDFAPVATHAKVFAPSKRIETVDPTAIPEF